jgi:hypothetical protein
MTYTNRGRLTSFLIIFITLFLVLLFLLPAGAYAADPSTSLWESISCQEDPTGCEYCHVVQAANYISMFLIYLASIIAVLMFVYAGSILIIFGENSTRRDEVKKIFHDVIIGFIIAIAAFFIIDMILKAFIGERAGPWNSVECPSTGNITTEGPRIDDESDLE